MRTWQISLIRLSRAAWPVLCKQPTLRVQMPCSRILMKVRIGYAGYHVRSAALLWEFADRGTNARRNLRRTGRELIGQLAEDRCVAFDFRRRGTGLDRSCVAIVCLVGLAVQ